MITYLRALFRFTRQGGRARLTPGNLYYRMSSEFRFARPREHGSCIMPMVVAGTGGWTSANWHVERMTSCCAPCERLAGRIARRYAARFDVLDFPRTPPAAQRGPAQAKTLSQVESHALGT